MIISKSDHLKKLEMAKPLNGLITLLTDCSVDELPGHLESNMLWERPHGDLFHWISVLNRFDEIFEQKIENYGLNQNTPKLQVIEQEDVSLLKSCLNFTAMLLENCSNGSIYCSSDRLYQLMNTPTVDVVLAVMEVLVTWTDVFTQQDLHMASIPKPVRTKILKIARSYPPPVPPAFVAEYQKESDNTNKDETRPNIVGNHYGLLDTIILKKKYPSKWKHLSFQYYRSIDLPSKKIADSQTIESSQDTKVEKKVNSKQKESRKKQRSDLKALKEEGVSSFSLSEDMLRKYSIEQILDKGSENIPHTHWFEFALEAITAKSFNSTSHEALKLREKLLRIKCMSVALVCCLCHTEFASSKLFEPEPYILSLLVDLINPENKEDVPTDIYATAMKSLDCISSKRAWRSDLFRCLGGNINHGELYHCIRYINKTLSTDVSFLESKSFISFFNMLGNLIYSSNLAQAMATGGLLKELMTFLNFHTKNRRLCSAAVSIITQFLGVSPESIDEFVNSNGFQLLIDTIGYEVKIALDDPDFEGGAPKDSVVYYKITFRQANYIRNLLKLTVHLIESDSGDRLRNLFDSPLLISFNDILRNPSLFGPSILSSTIDCVFFIIHNEPTAFSILNEAKVVETLLMNYQNMFLPSSDLVMSLSEVLGAICLNKEGLKQVIDHKTISSLFEIFYDLPVAKELVRSTTSANIGVSLEELGRHYPELSSIITKETEKLVNNIATTASERLQSIEFYQSANGSLYKSKQENVVDMEQGAKEILDWTSDENAYIIDNLILFLGGLSENGSYIKDVSFESLLKSLILQNSPFDITTMSGTTSLRSLLSAIESEKQKEKGYSCTSIEILVNEAYEILCSPKLKEFISFNNDSVSFFHISSPEVCNDLIKLFNKLHTLLFLLSEVYMESRFINFHLGVSNLPKSFGPNILNLVEILSKFLSRCIIEETLIRISTPDSVCSDTIPNSSSKATSTPLVVYASDPAEITKKQNKTSAKFKNTLQLRFFYYKFQKQITLLFNSMLCMDADETRFTADWRRRSVEMTVKIGSSLSNELKRFISKDHLRASFHLVLVNIIMSLLVLKESETIKTSSLISMIQNGVFEILKDIAISLWNDLLSPSCIDELSKKPLSFIKATHPSIVRNAMIQVLRIFSKVVNDDPIPFFHSIKKFFHSGYGGDPDYDLETSISIQVKSAGLKLVRDTVGSSTKLLDENTSVLSENVPQPIIQELIFISKQCFTDGKEYNVDFVPLDRKNVFPPEEEVAYLISLGFSDTDANHFFDHFNKASDLCRLSKPDCPHFRIGSNFWSQCASEMMNDSPEFKLEKGIFSNLTELTSLREKETSGIFERWLKLCQIYTEGIEDVSELLIKTTSDISEMLNKLLQDTLEISERDERDERLVVSVHFLLLFFKNDKTAKSHIAILQELTGLIKKEIANGIESINSKYYVYILAILEKMLLLDDLPIPEPTKHKTLTVNNQSLSVFRDNETRRDIFDCLLKLRGIENKEVAVMLARVLVLYAKDQDYASFIGQSPLIGNLTRLTMDFIENDLEAFSIYQTALSLLMARCYETADVLKSIMSEELRHFFDGTVRTRRDLQSCLRETATSVLRQPHVYTDVISRFIRIEGYDGTSDFYHNRITIGKKSDKVNEEDVEMHDAVSNVPYMTKRTQTGGIMNVLLSELIKTIKGDWFSNSEPQSKISQIGKNARRKEVYKNPLFAYASFLLKTIAELLGSYKEAKLDFLTFSKKKGDSGDVLKPHTTALNFLFHQLVPSSSFDCEGAEADRREFGSSFAFHTILALMSTPILNAKNEPDPKKEDIDMAFIRHFCVDLILKNLKGAHNPSYPSQVRYGKLIDLLDLSACFLSTRFRETTGPLLNKNATKYDQFYIARVMIEKQFPSQVMSVLTDVDLNHPHINEIIKKSSKVLTLLGRSRIDYNEYFEDQPSGEKDEDDIVPDDVDDREDTPDLFRNSTLGMYDVEIGTDSEEDMEYYDVDGPIEVLMSEDDMSDFERSSGLSELESGEDEDEDDDDDEDEMSIGESYEMAEDSDNNDLDVVQEFNPEEDSILSGSQSNSELSDYYEFENDEDMSEYDDEELDGWIEEFEEGVSDNEDNDNNNNNNRNHRRGSHWGGQNVHSLDLGASSRTPDDGRSIGEDSILDGEIDEDDYGTDSDRIDPSVQQSVVEFIRPGRNNSSGLYTLINGILGDSSGIIRRSLQIGDPHSFGFGSMLEQDSQGFLHLNSKRKTDPFDQMYVKSVKEKWMDSYRLFYNNYKDEIISRIIPAIVNRIEQESIEYNKKRKEEAEKLRKEKEEAKRKKEEERIRKNEEIRQREEAELSGVDATPVMVHIGDREVDISGTDIDPEFFEALPEDLREEVLTQHIRERRANASNTGESTREIDPDFLDALPDGIRQEILQQESIARRYSNLNEFRFGTQDEDDYDRMSDDSGEHPQEDVLVNRDNKPQKPKKGKVTLVSPLLERQGITSLVRLLFVPQSLNQRQIIYQALQFLCHSKQSRVDIMGLLIAILTEGVVNQRSIDKIFTSLSLKAKGSKDLKSVDLPLGANSIIVATQIIEGVEYLLEHNIHLRYYMLTEHDTVYLYKKGGKSKITEPFKGSKFPINCLLNMLGNKTISEESSFTDVLAKVLQVSTRPLHLLKKSNKFDDLKQIPFASPKIPDYNYRRLIRILTLNECPNTIFRRTVSTLQNLSVLPNAQTVFSIELSDRATELGQNIIKDLAELTNQLKHNDNHSTESKTLNKISAASSDQAKLLRVLTALDYMFETKDKGIDNSDSMTEPQSSKDLTGIYKRLELGPLWDALSETLRALEDISGLTKFATALLPLIEALMVVCKNSRVKDIQIKDVTKFEVKKVDFTKEPIENLFFSFTDEHKKILNQMVRTNPNLMSGPFGMLVRNPKVLEFDNKKNYFDRKLHKEKKENSKLVINIRRDQVFLDSYRALFFKSKDEFKNSQLDVNFRGEAGVDAGGVTREWYQVLSRQIFNPDYALFTPVASDETTFHPNRTSFVNPEHLSFFKFIGRIIGKAIYDNCFLDCHFSRAVYKRILGRPVSLKDMETLDLEYFKSLIWMLENDITDVITEDFSLETDDYGEHKVIELIPNGRNIPVTEENKHEYVQKVVEYRLQTSVADQMDNFLMGFHEIIPKDLVSIFDEQELELLISGLPDISVVDWQSNTDYVNYSPSSLQIQWFWRAVKSFDNEERAKLLQFATGTSKVPLNGFKELSGADGSCKFSIHRDYGSTERLPSSHTCFNQIDLPAYESYETLRGSLLLAITEGHLGFGLA